MVMSDSALLARIEAILPSLTRSETRVGEFILREPNGATEMSIGAIAEKVQVSEPTVARFCKSLGFSGLRAFKIGLARNLGADPAPPVFVGVAADDPAQTVIRKITRHAADALDGFVQTADVTLIQRAAAAIARARRLEFYGQGNSGIVALDGQHKFFRLGLATAAYSDPHIHAMSANLLGPGDVVVAISASGRTLDLIRSVEIARDAGALAIGICARGSPVAALCDITIATDMMEDGDLYAPMLSRLLHLTIIDMLAVLAAMSMGPELTSRLERAKRPVREKRRRDGVPV
jgi:RpiR family transcriptional regulator, carbohydrate utilization regulator